MTKSFNLVTQGKPSAEIYLSSRAAEPVRFAVDELQRYVGEMSGAVLPIKRASLSPLQIVVAPRLTVASLNKTVQDKGRKRTHSLQAEDTYRIQVTPESLVIAGANATAVVYGVYDCLERMGCGFCVPGDDTVPHRKTISLPQCEVAASPAFTYRAQVNFPLRSIRQSAALIDWLAKNRLNWYHAAESALSLPVHYR